MFIAQLYSKRHIGINIDWPLASTKCPIDNNIIKADWLWFMNLSTKYKGPLHYNKQEFKHDDGFQLKYAYYIE